MQPNKLLLSAALTLSCFLPFAQAEDWYAEAFTAGIFTGDSDGAIGPYDNELSSIGLRGGYQLTENFSLEVEAQTGSQGDTSYALGLGEIDLDAAYGLYGKYSVAVSDRFSLHGRVGLASNDYQVKSNSGGEIITTSNSFAFGVGTKFNLTDQIYLRSDLTQHNSISADSNSVSIGAGVRF